tara:strand:+ start:174 stop:1448 length:1275 start_codon:yes stop_codon:yes gene_type:complete
MPTPKKYIEGSVTYHKRTDGRSRYWRAYYYDPTKQKRVFKSLRCTTKSMAREKAKEINDAIEGGTLVRGEEVKKNRGITFAQVAEEYFNGDTKETPLLKKRKLRPAWKKSDETLKQERSKLTCLAPDLGNMPVQSMTGEFISDYLAKKSKKGIRGLEGGWKESSRNRYKSFISCVMHLAEQKNYINRWPMDDVIHVEEVVEEKEPLTQKQFEMMLSYLPPYVRVIMCFLRYTGMRASELHSLKWRDVKWPDDGSIGYIQLRAANEKGTKLSKRDEGRKIYMTRYISEKLEEMRSGTEWLINNRRVIVWPSDKNLNDLIIPHMSIAKAIDKAVAMLTKATEKFKGEKRWTIEKVTRHLMRHTWATDMAKNNDVKDSVLMRMGGWSSHSMMMRYAKEEDNLQKEAVSKLDGYGDPGDTNLEVIKSA